MTMFRFMPWWIGTLIIIYLIFFRECHSFDCVFGLFSSSFVVAMVITSLGNNTNEEEEEHESYRLTKEQREKIENHSNFVKFIGKKLNEKYGIVIFQNIANEMDIIAIYPKKDEINIVKCEVLSKDKINIDYIEKIYQRLKPINMIDWLKWEYISKHFILNGNPEELKEYYMNLYPNDNLKYRKTLYIGIDEIVDLENLENIEKINSNIFRYEDMKIVLVKWNNENFET